MVAMKLVAGTRGSALALKQVAIVAEALKQVDRTIEVETLIIKTQGDTNLSPIPLDSIGKGWFTRELEDSLLREQIDFAVHSLKDLAEEQPKGLVIAAYPAREDARDVLVSKKNVSIEKLPEGAVVGTDSTRRQAQVLALRSDLAVKSIRGNVPTRVEKLRSLDYDAIILAAAGLKRLEMENEIAQYFSVEEMTPAPGQGTLAVQIKKSNKALQKLMSKISDPEAERAALLERSFSKKAGGGCKSPSGAYAWREKNEWRMIAMLAQDDGAIIRERMSASADESMKLGERLAKKLLGKVHA